MSVHLESLNMPDVVPIVRRPVKKLNSPPDFELKSSGDKSIVGRKFNLPTEKNSVNKIKRFCEEKDTIAEKSKKSFNNDDDLPVPIISKYDVSQFTAKVAHGPQELKVAEKRVSKTNVSFFSSPALFRLMMKFHVSFGF